MFSTATRAYFEHLPELPGLEATEARRVLSAAYADVLAVRDGFAREAGPAASEVANFLHRLTGALESYAVFPEDVSAEERHAAAFIAAESLSLTRRVTEEVETEAEPDEGPEDDGADQVQEPTYRLLRRATFVAVEAALLYVVGGLETNGSLLLADIGEADAAATTAEATAAERALEALVAFVQLSVEPVAPPNPVAALEESSVESNVRAAAFTRLADAALEHVQWLRGGDEARWQAAVASLRESATLLTEAGASRYADVLHLSRLLLRGIEETADRAIRRIPAPASERYAEYIHARAQRRPLIWPSGVEYVTQCLPGPRHHAAVALPTGSGKSFIAELAASQAVLDGWVLYLVPTNALAVQVRRDLAGALTSLDASVRAFVGGSEYTELAGEAVADVEIGTVMVMTPEKCALALRRSPEAFETLRLCVFDECHLISESGGRGVLAELVAAHILATAPHVRFLLLSAMIENPEAATAWLEAATGITALPVKTPWRPTRTLRGVLGFERNAYLAASDEAPGAFAGLPASRVNVKRQVPYAALVNLQGAWTDLSDDEYSILLLDRAGTLTAHRTRSGDVWNYALEDDGYLNPTLADIASLLRERGERVLAFVPRNRHHVFSVAAAIIGGDDIDLNATADGLLVDAYLALAGFEIGAPTAVAELIRRGIAVHSSALADAERTASELAFQRGVANVMVATGTLAQGLNLPATAVLVGGTEIGFTVDPDADQAARVRAQLLNAIGRSGRPGVANHGLALVIPNKAVSFDAGHLNATNALQGAWVLAHEDASVPFTSRLGSLVSQALEGALVGDAMSTDELAAYTYLPEATVQDALAQRILQRTYGVWQVRPDAIDEAAATVAHALQGVGEQFVAGANAPAWTTEVAYRSGLSLLDVFEIYRSAFQHLDHEPPTDIEAWLVLLIDVLRSMPLRRVQALVIGDLSLKGLGFAALAGETEPPAEAWAAFTETMLLYLRGETISAIAAYATQTDPPISQSRTVGSNPIPKTLSFIQRMSYALSLVAGGLAALWIVGGEQALADETAAAWALPAEARVALDSLPLAVRCGASDRSSLAWYRFGIRHRVAAHALARSFPLPEGVDDETAVQAWIRETRRSWQDETVEAGDIADPAVARAIRRVASYEGVQ